MDTSQLPKMDFSQKLILGLRVLQATLVFPYSIVLDVVVWGSTARLVIGRECLSNKLQGCIHSNC